jgi:hypothetical protein
MKIAQKSSYRKFHMKELSMDTPVIKRERQTSKIEC